MKWQVEEEDLELDHKYLQNNGRALSIQTFEKYQYSHDCRLKINLSSVAKELCFLCLKCLN